MKKHLFFVTVLLIHFVFAADPYRPPNMKKEIFNAKNIKMDKISNVALFTGLICVARDFDQQNHGVDYGLRSNALAIAGRLDPASESFREVSADLKVRGKSIKRNGDSKVAIASKIYRGIRVLMRKTGNRDHMKCAAYCIDIALRLAPAGPHAKRLKEYQAITGKADWNGLVENPTFQSEFFSMPRNEFKGRSETMAGGKASKFSATQRKLYALPIRKLANGNRVASASPLIATALRDPDIDGIKFNISQKVGNQMGLSLGKMEKLMQVRHEEDKRIPSGYKVEIAFSDREGLLDGSSTEIAMALAIDALFTGRELDEKFAMTGAITNFGKITPIGGLADKVQCAIDSGCKLVGIPHGNVVGVSDLVLLDGIERFTTTQVFSFKSLDEAMAVASKKKAKHIQQAIDDFDHVSSLLIPRGDASLSDAKIIALLEKIVEKVPNHQSARNLLNVAKGREKKSLSLGGSFKRIDFLLSTLRPTLRKLVFSEALVVGSEDRVKIKETYTEIEELRPKLDSELKNYHQVTLGALVTLTRGRLPDEEREAFQKRFRDAWKKLEGVRQKLIEKPEINAELKL